MNTVQENLEGLQLHISVHSSHGWGDILGAQAPPKSSHKNNLLKSITEKLNMTGYNIILKRSVTNNANSMKSG